MVLSPNNLVLVWLFMYSLIGTCLAFDIYIYIYDNFNACVVIYVPSSLPVGTT